MFKNVYHNTNIGNNLLKRSHYITFFIINRNKKILFLSPIDYLEDPVLCEIVSPWSLHDHGSEGVGVSHLGHFV